MISSEKISGPTITKPVCARCWQGLHAQRACFDPSAKPQAHNCKDSAGHEVIVPDTCLLGVHVLMNGTRGCACSFHTKFAEGK